MVTVVVVMVVVVAVVHLEAMVVVEKEAANVNVLLHHCVGKNLIQA